MKKWITLSIFGILISTSAQASTISDQVTQMALQKMVAKHAPYFSTNRSKGEPEAVGAALCPYNIPTRVDFDNNWIASDNENAYASLIATNGDLTCHPENHRDIGMNNAYYEILTSKTHAFIVYYLFFPHDAGDNCAFEPTDTEGGHLNDSTSITLIIHLDDAEGQLEWIITMDHYDPSIFKPEAVKLEKGHPLVVISNGNHTLSTIPTDSDLTEQYYFEDYYHFGGGNPYDLYPIYSTLWAERHNQSLFCSELMGIGVQFCGEGNDAALQKVAPWAPWARDFSPTHPKERSPAFQQFPLAIDIPSFIDPIGAFHSLYPDSDESNYSMEYGIDPYLPDLFPKQ